MIQQIDIERIERRLNDIWEIGETERGGVTRLAYSDEETAAIEYICDELDDQFDIRTDSIGNVFATPEPDADSSLYLGSHLDSVFNGGRLDGVLGVITALEAIEIAYEVGTPCVPPTLTIFRAEESSRFGQWGIGSRGALGKLTVEDFSATDQRDIPLWQAMQQQGFQSRNLSSPTIDLNRIAGFLELHIEQGRVLDETDTPLGIVSSIRAPIRYRITVYGDYDHSGATPMDLRRDAIAGTAEMIRSIEVLGKDAARDGDLVVTVGDVTTSEGAINKVCGEVSFPIDIRSNNSEYREEVTEMEINHLKTIADRRDLDLEIKRLDRSEPVELNEEMVALLDDLASNLDVSYRQLPSGGGHDAMHFQNIDVPTGMLFVPSVGGVSHSPKEETPNEAIRDATAVLTKAILEGPLHCQ